MSPIARTSSMPARPPAMIRRVLRHAHAGRIIETEVIAATLGDWADCPESAGPGWQALYEDRVVFAVRPVADRIDIPVRALGMLPMPGLPGGWSIRHAIGAELVATALVTGPAWSDPAGPSSPWLRLRFGDRFVDVAPVVGADVIAAQGP